MASAVRPASAGESPDSPGGQGPQGRGSQLLLRHADPVRDLDRITELCEKTGRRPWTAAMLEPREDRAALVCVGPEGMVLGVAKTHFHLEADGVAPAGHYLGGILVHPEHRRHGVGTALTRARLEWIAARARKAHYFANALNTASIRLHQGFGFHEVARSPVLHGVPTDRPGEELVLFAMDLPAGRLPQASWSSTVS